MAQVSEYLAEGFIDFGKQEKTLEVAGVVVRREGYVKLSELVEDLQTLEFAEFMSLTESEEKLLLELLQEEIQLAVDDGWDIESLEETLKKFNF